MPLFLQIPHTVLRQSDTVFIHVMKKNGVLRATALSRARGKGEVWRGETSGLRTLSGFLPSKFGVQGFSLEKYKTWHGICFMLSVQRKKSSFRVQKT